MRSKTLSAAFSSTALLLLAAGPAAGDELLDADPFSLHRIADPLPPRAPAGSAAIDFSLTGTTDLSSEQCGPDENFAVPPGTDILFCYLAANIGTITLTRHDLADSAATIFTDYPFVLDPGFGAWITQIRRAGATTTNNAQWTAYNPGPVDVASDFDSSIITVTPPLLACNGSTVTFTGGLPVGFTSFDGRALAFLGDSDVDWKTVAGCGEAGNYTGGRGDAACASSDPVPAQPYDAELRTHRLDLSGQTSARLEFLVNYQDFDGGDELDVDVSTDGGVVWETVATAVGSYGAFRATPGATVSIDLAPYLAGPGPRVRWRYHNDSPTASNWYVQVDNVQLLCGGGLFFDGFESGNTDAWSLESNSP
jgi:hypothetical protein